MQPVITKRFSNLILFLSVIVLFSLISLVAINTAFTVTDEIYNGVKVGDINVGGLSTQAAEAKIATTFREKIQHPPIALNYQERRWTISAQEIDLEIDAVELARQAYAVGRTGNIFYRLQERYLTINQGRTIPLTLSYSGDKLLAILTNIAGNIDREPQSASLLAHTKSSVTIISETIGQKVDLQKTIDEITANLNAKIPFSLELVVNQLSPDILAKDLAGIDGVIASYSTQFSQEDQNRSENIALAAKSINGVLVRRGEIFSFNTYVGPRLAQYGYKIAPVFINGKLMPDWGGGVCQVSSTLYNAALLADMKIEERTAHFRPPGYIPLGQDATVADNQLDFKFKNTSSHNIYIKTVVTGYQLTVSVFGQLTANPPEILIVAVDKKVLEPNTIVKQDPSLELGKEVVEVEGQKGFQVSTFRVKYNNGKEIGREFLASDEFSPEDRVVRVGTKAPKSNK